MSVFTHLEERVTGMRRPDEFARQPVEIAFESVLTGAERPSTYTLQHEHELRLRLYSRFWCNQAEYGSAKEIAERVLANLLYEDVLVALGGIMHAISDGDRRAALSRCGELMDSLRR